VAGIDRPRKTGSPEAIVARKTEKPAGIPRDMTLWSAVTEPSAGLSNNCKNVWLEGRYPLHRLVSSETAPVSEISGAQPNSIERILEEQTLILG